MIVDIYQFSLIASSVQQRAAEEVLSGDERLRFARMIDPFRNRSIIAHATLRCLLGARLGQKPKDVSFEYGLHGKPRLVQGAMGTMENISFNLAHSADKAMIAIGQGDPVGIDLEEMKNEAPHDLLTSDIFTSREIAFMQNLSLDQRKIVFYKAWTCKEAFVKATGEGMSRALSSIEIEFGCGNRARIATIPMKWAAMSWSLVPLDTFPGFSGALVVGNRQITVRRHEVSVQLPIEKADFGSFL